MAAAGSGEPVTPEDRRAQPLERADELISEIPPEERRLYKVIFYLPHGRISPLEHKLGETAFFSYTKPGAIVAFRDWFDKICPELDATKAEPGAALKTSGMDYERRIFDGAEARRARLDVPHYVDDYFNPESKWYQMMEVPLEHEEVYSPDCRIGPKCAAAEPDADDAE